MDLILPDGIGVALVACAEAEDVIVTLHGDEGVELNRYLVDVHPTDPAPVPQAAPGKAHQDVRICVDGADNRGNYLDGWEYAGAPLVAGDFGLAGTLTSVELQDLAGNQYRYFFAASLDAGAVQMRVSPAGAGNSAGLDVDRVYPLAVAVEDDQAETATLTIAFWLDRHTLSPNDDGRCA